MIIMILVIGIGVFAQSGGERKAARKANKEAKLKEDKEKTDALIQLVETRQFVLEAQSLYGKQGAVFQLGNNLNFVMFNNEESTIQLAFNHLIGWNGVGGVTTDGRISDFKIKKNNKGTSFTINATVMNKGRSGLVTMIFRVSSGGKARVDMSGNFGSRLSFDGNIVPLSESRVFKGMTRF